MKRFKRLLKKIKWRLIHSFAESWYVFCRNHMSLKTNAVLLQSRYGEDLGGNIFYVLKELSQNYKDYELYLPYKKKIKSSRKDEPTQEEKIFYINGRTRYETLLKKYDIQNVSLVELHKAKYWHLLATCKYLVNDVTFHTAFIKREGQVYLNTWHGTPLKKMGLDENSSGYLFGNMQRNFFAADYLLCPNTYMSEIMAKAYRLKNLFKGKIVNAGYPRNAIFLDKQRATEIKKELNLGNKQIIVYMPTWRGASIAESYIESLDQYLDDIDRSLNNNQIFFVKLHPKAQDQLDLSKFEHILPFPSDYETYDFLNIADCLVTDYSSVMFDFACSRKQIILFTYDEEEYLQDRGLYISISTLPFTKVKTVDQLINAINTGKDYKEDSFIEELIKYENKNATKNMCELLLHQNGTYSTYAVERNNKENVLIFVDNLLKNGIISSVFNLINVIDLQERNYLFVFKESTVKPHKERILDIPSNVGVLSLGTLERTFLELASLFLYYKLDANGKLINKYVDSCYKRNFLKYYGNIDIDYFVQFIGYGRDMLQIFLQGQKKIVFVHNDMRKEILERKVQHKNTLVKCYQNYDIVAAVSERALMAARELGHGIGKYRIVHNTCDYNGIKERALKPISFEEDTECLIDNQRSLDELLNDRQTTKFITIGRFSPEKGHLRLIDAFERYWLENNNSFLIIVGGHGVLYKTTVDYVDTKQCKQNVIIIKSIMNPMPILKACNLFVLSSSYEGLPMVLYEATCLKVPILSTNIDGPREFLTQYHGGLLVDESTDGLYEGMKAFDRGEIKVLDIDFEKYNQQCIEEFESLFTEVRN